MIATRWSPSLYRFPLVCPYSCNPTAWCENLALECLDAGDAGKLGLADSARCNDDKLRFDRVVAVGPDDPAPDGLTPAQLRDPGVE
jgi:hypothetical protein